MKPFLRIPALPALAGALLLSACAVTRVEPPPPPTAPSQYREAGPWLPAGAAQPVPEAWWSLFGDPDLDALEQRLEIGNQNLRIALTQVASARAALAASGRAMLPKVSVGLSATRSGSPGTPGDARQTANSVALAGDASWEIDLWGRLSMAQGQARDSLRASEADLAAVRLSAQALLAQTYFALRSADAQAALYARSVAAYQRSLALTEDRLEAGVAQRTDVLQAQTQLHAAQAQQADNAAQRAQAEHALAVLIGVAPSALALPARATLPSPPEVPATLPATLLERRPDIAAARARVEAAYAQIGIADAAWFPSLTLSASAGFRNNALAGLVAAPNLFWSVGPALAQSLLDGGQRALASAQARAGADAATATYRQTVLGALQEVEDNLALVHHLRDEARLQQQALAAARRTLRITLDQYRAGTVGYLSVVSAQAATLDSESALNAVRNRQLAAINLVLKNIAGSWPPG
jgi:NodT family efflux transporter outer membrane factor (OMF) lipoprotein